MRRAHSLATSEPALLAPTWASGAAQWQLATHESHAGAMSARHVDRMPLAADVRAPSSKGATPIVTSVLRGFDFSRVAATTSLLQRTPDAGAPDAASASDGDAGARRPATDAGQSQPAEAKDASSSDAQAPEKRVGCGKGCAQRWGMDTTCSKFGFRVGESEHAGQFVADPANKKRPFMPCCNSWPYALERFARGQLGLAGAASCPATHQQEIATVSLGDKSVRVLCSDTIPTAMVGASTAAECKGKIAKEVIELSPHAMQDLAGQTGNALHVGVCFSGAKRDELCFSSARNPRKRPEARDCLTAGCSTTADTPNLKDIPWPPR